MFVVDGMLMFCVFEDWCYYLYEMLGFDVLYGFMLVDEVFMYYVDGDFDCCGVIVFVGVCL